jgi:putative membrane protein
MDELDPHFWDKLLRGFCGTLVFGVTGIIMAVLGFKVFDWITPRIDVQRELAEKNNLAVAIVCAAIILGVSFIAATVVH